MCIKYHVPCFKNQVTLLVANRNFNSKIHNFKDLPEPKNATKGMILNIIYCILLII